MKKQLLLSFVVALSANLSAQNVGIGTTTPVSKFSVGNNSQFQVDSVGNIKSINNVPYSFPSMQASSGQILSNNGSGTLSWVNQLGGWSLTGNAGNPPGYFIGTTDTMPLYFRVNNVQSGKLDQVKANVFMGSYAGGNIATGDGNSGIGFNSLTSLTSGTSNSAIGTNSLRNNTTGSSNVAIGANAIYTNTVGSSITAIGSSALYANTSGSSNTAVGANSLISNTQGNSNTALGNNSMYNNTLGGSNTSVGVSSMFTNTIGASNTAIGNGALYKNANGSTNTAIGNSALYYATSNANTAVGANALFTLTYGENNTALGNNADISFDSLNNTTTLGYAAISTGNNQVTLGNINITAVRSAGTYGTLSDGRFKENVVENVSGLDFILQLRPVTYTINTEKLHNFNNKLSKSKKMKPEEYAAASAVVHTGFIAQEVEEAANKLHFNFDGIYKPTNATDNYSLSYGQFVVPLVKAVQELNKKVEDQEALIKNLTKRLEALENK